MAHHNSYPRPSHETTDTLSLVSLPQLCRRPTRPLPGHSKNPRSHRISVRQGPGIERSRTFRRIARTPLRACRILNDPPPSPLSAIPNPPNKGEPPPSTLPPFPITPEGFGTHTSAGGATQANADSELLTQLYSRIAARDEPGLFQLVNTAATPFQKTLALAGMEHLLLQRGDRKGRRGGVTSRADLF